MASELKISVSADGPIASGKTTTLQKIAECLEGEGFNISQSPGGLNHEALTAVKPKMPSVNELLAERRKFAVLFLAARCSGVICSECPLNLSRDTCLTIKLRDAFHITDEEIKEDREKLAGTPTEPEASGGGLTDDERAVIAFFRGGEWKPRLIHGGKFLVVEHKDGRGEAVSLMSDSTGFLNTRNARGDIYKQYSFTAPFQASDPERFEGGLGDSQLGVGESAPAPAKLVVEGKVVAEEVA